MPTPGVTATLRRADGSSLQRFNLGIVDNITMTLKSSVQASPIIIFGYSGTFLMDTGVSGTLSLGLNRVSPSNPTTGGDSTKWSNAYWATRMKSEQDRWQATHDGYILDVVPADTTLFPTLSLTGYVTSFPLSFSTNTVDSISYTLGFKIGRLKQK